MKNSFVFAIDSIHIHFRKFILSVALMFICSLILLFTQMAYRTQNLVYETCDQVLENGIKSTGIIQLIDNDFYNNDSILKYLNELKKQKEIYAVGDCVEYLSMDTALTPLKDIQKEYYGNGNYTAGIPEDDGLHIWETMNTTFLLCRTELSSGIPVEQLDFSSDNVYYLYLGCAFQDIPVGTAYQVENDIYKVAGILSTGQEWIKQDLLMDFSFENVTATQLCDYMVFKIADNRPPLTDYLWISASNGYSIQDAMDTADRLAQKMNIEVHYSSLQERYEVSSSITITLLGYLYKIIWIVGITSMLMIISLQIVFILANRKEYGILSAIGFSQKEVLLSVLFYNVLISITAILLLIPCLYAIARYWFPSCRIDYMVKHIFLPYLLPTELFMVGVMLFVVTILTIVMLHILTPVQMLRSNNGEIR